MNNRRVDGARAVGAVILLDVLSSALLLAGCVVSPTHVAPIVDRSQAEAQKPAPAPKPPQGATPARVAHQGLYDVQPGDTLYSVALSFAQDPHDVARWNGIDEQAPLRPGQALRVAPPTDEDAAPAEAVPVAPPPSNTIEAHPLSAEPLPPPAPLPPAPGPSSEAPAMAPSASASAATPPGPVAAVPPPAVPSPSEAAAPIPPTPSDPNRGDAPNPGPWGWPGSGPVLKRFDKQDAGIDLGGNVGDPVLAANDGQVVYIGNGLRGWGKLVIIKHTDEFISAYGHNKEVLVTQGQAVKRGQRIAELGMTDASSPMLHFEIRRKGLPVDPMTYLPSR